MIVLYKKKISISDRDLPDPDVIYERLPSSRAVASE